MESKKKILIFIDWFLPGYKAGGPIRSMANMVSYLNDKYEFFIFTGNTDYTETTPYSNINYNEWTDFDKNIKVFYSTKDKQNYNFYKQIIKQFDLVYINGVYSLHFSILPLIAAKKLKTKTIVAARGMLAKSAINLKGNKKKLFLKTCKLFNLYKDVIWHVTNEKEGKDVKREINKSANYIIANNLPKKNLSDITYINKQPNNLKIISLARIAPEKNTLFILKKLTELNTNANITLHLLGQIYDNEYWNKCKNNINSLSSNITVEYKGTVDGSAINETIQNYHILILPSLGENFGHVILESFMAARPVIISDQTPWLNLESEKCGFDMPLDNNKIWKENLHKFIDMPQQEFDLWCENARKKAENFIYNPELKKSYEKLLG